MDFVRGHIISGRGSRIYIYTHKYIFIYTKDQTKEKRKKKINIYSNHPKFCNHICIPFTVFFILFYSSPQFQFYLFIYLFIVYINEKYFER